MLKNSIVDRLCEPKNAFAWNTTFTALAMILLVASASPDSGFIWIAAHVVLAAIGACTLVVAISEWRISRRSRSSFSPHGLIAAMNTLLCAIPLLMLLH